MLDYDKMFLKGKGSMKKRFAFLFIFALFLFVPFVSTVDAKQVVNVYLFYGDGCPHCANAEEFFDDLKEDSNYSGKFNLVEYEVWYNDDNADLMEEVGDELDTTVTGVPFIVVGDQYFEGYTTAIESSIKTAITDAYYDSDYEDVVRSVRFGSKANEVKEKVEDDVTTAIEDIFDSITGNSTTTTTTDVDGAVAVGVASVMVIVIITIVLSLAVYAYYVIIYWKVFKKAGRNGWEAIIPFYNYWVLFEISGYPGAYSLFILIPCAGPIIFLVFSIMAAISLAKKFKKADGFHVLLWLIPIVGYSILAFDSSTYDGKLGEHKNKN